MSHYHFAKFAVCNASRVFLFLAMAHPAMAIGDATDMAHAAVEEQASDPAPAPAAKTPPVNAPSGLGWG